MSIFYCSGDRFINLVREVVIRCKVGFIYVRKFIGVCMFMGFKMGFLGWNVVIFVVSEGFVFVFMDVCWKMMVILWCVWLVKVDKKRIGFFNNVVRRLCGSGKLRRWVGCLVVFELLVFLYEVVNGCVEFNLFGWVIW